jgi:hypothetical protein
MAKPAWRPQLSADYVAAARTYAVDVVAAAVLFVVASIAAGRVWRFPFDDEIYTLDLIERMSPLRLVTTFPGQVDVHPPLSYLVFSALQHLGAGAPAMRLASLAMTALALALFHLLALSWMAARRREAIQPASRLIAVVLFGLCPLAIGEGAALRWYPLFAVLIALFTVLYLAGRNDAARLCAAAALGLAGSTNILAAAVTLAFAIYRYALQRQFKPAFDAAFWLVAAVFGCVGLYTAGSLVTTRRFAFASELGNGVLSGALTDALGFFGGDALGVSQAWIVVPAIAIAALAVYAAFDRKRPSAPSHFLLLLLATAALTVLPGFARPRSFLYLAPVVMLLVVRYLDRLLRQGHWRRVLTAAALLTAVNAAVIANVGHSTHPFKRNAVIPYRSIFDFIAANGKGRVLVMSTDPVVAWELRRQAGLCASYFIAERACFAADARYDAIFVVHGHSDKASDPVFIARAAEALTRLLAGRQRLATLPAGRDEDAALKSRLTGVPLEEAILTVDLYR